MLGGVEIAAVGAQLDVVRLLGIVHPHQIGGLPGDLRAFGDDRADELAAKVDLVGLQHPQLLVLVGGEPGGVLVSDHRDHAFERLGRSCVDLGDPAAGDGRLQRMQVERIDTGCSKA